MLQNFDRRNESVAFSSACKQILFFLNAKANGMTTFLLHELKNIRYIFVNRNSNDDIIIDTADRASLEYKDDRIEMYDIIINFEKLSNFSTNLLYFVPTLGTFLRNAYRDLFDQMIKKNNEAKYSFENFLDDYFIHFGNDLICLVLEHVETYSLTYLNKLKAIAQKYPNIKLIFTCDSPAIKAEILTIFSDFDQINFSKPSYEDACTIFEGLHLNNQIYNRKMYNSADNILDFLDKYYSEAKRIESSNLNNLIESILSQFDCYFNKYIVDQLCHYLIVNNRIESVSEFEGIISQLLNDRIISERGDYYSYNLKTRDKALNIMFDSFLLYLLNNYQELNIDALYFVFCYKPSFLTPDMIIYVVQKLYSPMRIKAVINYIKENIELTFVQYKLLYTHLFNLKLFHMIPEFNMKCDRELARNICLLNTITKEKQHLPTSCRIYQKNIKRYIIENIDYACLNAVLLLDFAINHKRKLINEFTNKNGAFYEKKFSKSTYYYILQSVVAYYLHDTVVALDYYNCAIKKSSGVEQLLMLNNKLAFLIMEYIKGNVSENIVTDAFKELESNEYFNGSAFSFINHNVYLYKSVVYKKNMFPEIKDEVFNTTWELFKKLNYLTFEFVYSNIDVNQYYSIKNEIISSNRFPACNFFYYNLYIIAKSFNHDKYIKEAEHYLDHDANFKQLSLYNKYLNLKEKSGLFIYDNREQLVKHGLIFSRLFDLNYLFKTIADLTK